jgi:2-octaprenyl-6-methoxyphenol hydroxylase
MMKPERSLELVNLPDEAFARVLQGELHGALGRVSNVRGRVVFPMRWSTAARFAASRTLFVGESAHAMPPIGAQGLNMGFRDAATAVELIAQARAEGRDIGGFELGEAYDRKRRRDVLARQGVVHAMDWSLLSDWPLPHAARALGLSAGAAIPVLRQAIMRQGMGTSGDLPEAMRGRAT